jgi:excinuclease ABC subunit C
VIYVGKAKNLRDRVGQYMAGSDERMMVPFLVSQAKSVDFVATATEKEALLLENTLIKQHRPRFNVKLRDDSSFLHLRIDTNAAWPRYDLVRRVKRDKARYFGPYHSASRARKTLAFLQRAFPLRTCTDQVLKSRTRPCLLHQMDRCSAPCVDAITRPEYDKDVTSSMWMLQGKTRPLIDDLRTRMTQAAEVLAFERAAHFRDLMADVKATVERQQVVDLTLADRDVWGLHREGSRGTLAIIAVREGVMGEPRVHALSTVVGSNSEVLSTLLNTAYPEGAFLPPEVLLPELPGDHQALEDLLSERRGKRVHLVSPQRGEKRKTLSLAQKNATLRFQQDNDANERHRLAMEELARVLELEKPPTRMECFDNSHLAGTNPVAAMSVFIDGKPDRAEYRRFKIKEAAGDDDYAMMREILFRRFRRALEGEPRPDLLVVDGGKGQLGVAQAVLHDLGIHDQRLVGIAKPRTEHRRGDRSASDKLVLPHRKEPLRLGSHHPGLRIVQHLRDEAHRHAVRYQRKVRDKKTLTSVLQEIPGIGEVRRKALLKTLGSAEAVSMASLAELESVPGIGHATAQAILKILKEDGS